MADRSDAAGCARRNTRHAYGPASHGGRKLDGRVPQLRHNAWDRGGCAAQFHRPSAGTRGRYLSCGVLETWLIAAFARHEGMKLLLTPTVMRRRRAPFGLAVFGLAALMLGLCGSAATAEPFRIIISETEMPVVPNSVIDLAGRLGFYKQAGVDVELVRVQQTPSVVAALHSGQGQMANVGFDAAVQLLARGQMKLKGVISPDKALPFLIAAKKAYTSPKQLEGKVFGVARVGS